MFLNYVKWQAMEHIYLNCNPTGSQTYGQLLNHSSLHPNAITKIYATGKNKLDVIFVAKHDITVDEEIVWGYGKKYTGVNPCVTSCLLFKNTCAIVLILKKIAFFSHFSLQCDLQLLWTVLYHVKIVYYVCNIWVEAYIEHRDIYVSLQEPRGDIYFLKFLFLFY